MLKMRILNDPVIRTHTIGIYPEGMLHTFSFLFFFFQRSLIYSCIDLPVQEIYKQVVVPDMYQLENGVMIRGASYVGSIHFIAGDHQEICALAGLPGAPRSKHTHA